MNPEASMIETSEPRQPVIATVLRILVVFDTVALLFAAALHVQGMRIPLGSTILDEPTIVDAAIVEGLAGLIFAVTAYAVFAGKRWTWPMALVAHVFAILGFLVGIAAISFGLAPSNLFDFAYHRVMLTIFVVGLVLLLLPTGRATLRHRRTQ